MGSKTVNWAGISDKRVVWDAISHYELTERTDPPGFKNRRLSKEGFAGHIILELRECKGRV